MNSPQSPSNPPIDGKSREFKVTISSPRHCDGCNDDIPAGTIITRCCKHCTWWTCPVCKVRNKGRVK